MPSSASSPGGAAPDLRRHPTTTAASAAPAPGPAEQAFLRDLGRVGRHGPAPAALKGLAADCLAKGWLVYREIGGEGWYFLSERAQALLGACHAREREKAPAR